MVEARGALATSLETPEDAQRVDHGGGGAAAPRGVRGSGLAGLRSSTAEPRCRTSRGLEGEALEAYAPRPPEARCRTVTRRRPGGPRLPCPHESSRTSRVRPPAHRRRDRGSPWPPPGRPCAAAGDRVMTPIGGGYETPTLEGFALAAAEGASGPTVDLVVVPSAYGDAPRRPGREPRARPGAHRPGRRRLRRGGDRAVHRLHRDPGRAARPCRRAGPGQRAGARRPGHRRRLHPRGRPGAGDAGAGRQPGRGGDAGRQRPRRRGRRHQRGRGGRVAVDDQRLRRRPRPRGRAPAGLDADVVGRRR